jgi:hypothetical protein
MLTRPTCELGGEIMPSGEVGTVPTGAVGPVPGGKVAPIPPTCAQAWPKPKSAAVTAVINNRVIIGSAPCKFVMCRPESDLTHM